MTTTNKNTKISTIDCANITTSTHQYDLKPAKGPLPFRMTNDFLFKFLLQSDTDILKHIICSFYSIAIEDIKDITVLNPVTLSDNIATKEMILDIKADMNDDTIVNLEMQVVNYHDWPERSLSYLCRCFDNLPKGADYSTVMSAVHIGFLNYTLFPDEPEFFATYRLKNIKTGKIYSSKFQLSVVDLTKIDMATPEDKENNRNLWAAFFKAKTWEELYMLAEKDASLEKAVTKVYQLSEEEKFRQQCQSREDFLRQQRDRDKYYNNIILSQKAELETKDNELQAKDNELQAKDNELQVKTNELNDAKSELAKYKQALINAGIDIDNQ